MTRPLTEREVREMFAAQDRAEWNRQERELTHNRGGTAVKKCKAIIVVDVEMDDDWAPRDVRENMPDWVEAALGRSAAIEDSRGGKVYYYAHNPTVYTSLADFDADRHDKRDHFTDQAEPTWAAGFSGYLNLDKKDA